MTPAIDYTMLNTMERRLLQKRPLNMWSVLCLRKPVMRRFLRVNNTRYKTKDRKKRLMRLILQLVRRNNNPQKNPNAASKTISPPRRMRLGPGQHMRGYRCICDITLSDLVNQREDNFPRSFIGELKKLLKASPKKIEEVLVKYGREPDTKGCRATNLKKIKEAFVEDRKLLIQTLGVEYARIQAMYAGDPECFICTERGNNMCVSVPCGHITCVICSEKFKNHPCPVCRNDIKVFIIIQRPENHSAQELQSFTPQ